MPKQISKLLRITAGLAALVWAVVYLTGAIRGDDLAHATAAVLASPVSLAGALTAYTGAFALRTWAWRRILPALSYGQAWAAIHVGLLGNHVLPLRLGEALRPLSVARRTSIGLRPATASTVTLRAADLLAVVLLALAIAPATVRGAAGDRLVALALVVLIGLLAGGIAWSRRHPGVVALPGLVVAVSALAAWLLEAVVVWEVARAAGVSLTPYEAVAITAVTVAAQALAVTPGGFGTYEAVATAALVVIGVPTGPAFAIALSTHAVKTAYALVVGGVALALPAPSFWGRLRLSRVVPPRPPALPVQAEAPVVVLIPVYDEEDAVGQVVPRVPATCAGREVVVLVVDDGSTDRSAALAAAAGARVVAHKQNLGLGAAVRTGLARACSLSPGAVVYLDADGEYFPEDIESVAAPVLSGDADYVVGSRFAGDIRRMRAHRRAGNFVLTRWVRWLARRRDLTDGQSGFRAFSAAAAADAEIGHDYNYAQVLTLDLLAKGYAYAEVPITYTFRESGQSFVRLSRYLRRVIPAVHRELNSPTSAQSSTTWLENRSRAAAQAASSRVPSDASAATAS